MIQVLSRIGLVFSLLIFNHYNIHAQAPTLVWAHQYGGTGVTLSERIAADDSGNVYNAGLFRGTADLDPGTLVSPVTATGNPDIYITKVNAAGNLVWAKTFRGTASKSYDVDAIAVDDLGNVYTAGYFVDSMDVDPGPGVHNLYATGGTNDGFLCKLNASGDLVWAINIGGTGWAGLGEISLDRAGNIYLSGAFFDTADVDPGPGIHKIGTAGQATRFILKLNSRGEFIWEKILPGNGFQLIAGKGVHELYAALAFNSTLSLPVGTGTQTIVPDSPGNVLIVKLDAAGTILWAKQIGGKSCGVADINMDRYGNLYLTGSFTGTVDFDPDPAGTHYATALGQWRSPFSGNVFGATIGYVMKLDSSGALQWASKLEVNRSCTPQGLVVEAAGKAVYSIGIFRDTIDLDPGTGTLNFVSGTESNHIYVSKLDAYGNVGWGASFGNATANANGYGIATEKSGHVYAGGDFIGQVDFDPGSASLILDPATTGSSGRDAFVQKLFDCRYMSDEQTLSGADSVCLGDMASYQVPAIPGATYIWELPNGWVGSSDSNIIHTTVTGTGVISVRAAGVCDTGLAVSLQVAIRIVDVTISVNGNVLSTAATDYDSWQWYRNDTLINGATNATYTATANGHYSVVVTKSGCSDTDYYSISNISVHDLANDPVITVYPNPAGDVLHIISTVAANVTLSDIEGRQVLQAQHAGTIDISGLAKGVYLLMIRNTEGRLIKVENIVKR